MTGEHELPQAGSPLTDGRYSLEIKRRVALCGARESAAPAAGAKRKGHLRFPFLFGLLPFPCQLVWRRLPTCDRCEMGERQRIFSSVSFSTYSQCQIHYCYTCGFIFAGATYPCCATRERVMIDSTCEFRRSVQSILAGPVYHNALTNRAALLCRTQRRVARLCSRIMVSDAANTRIHERTQCVSAKKNPLPFLYFAAVTCR